MRKLTERTKKQIEKTVGLPFDQIVEQPLSVTTEHIEKRLGRKLKITGYDGKPLP